MKKTIRISLFLLILSACEPRELDTVEVRNIWKVASVKENGKVVYQEGSPSGIRTGYVNFRLNLTSVNSVLFTDVDGKAVTGKWSLTRDAQKLLLQDLTPLTADSSGKIQFDIVGSDRDILTLKRSFERKKTEFIIKEYRLVPE